MKLTAFLTMLHIAVQNAFATSVPYESNSVSFSPGDQRSLISSYQNGTVAGLFAGFPKKTYSKVSPAMMRPFMPLLN